MLKYMYYLIMNNDILGNKIDGRYFRALFCLWNSEIILKLLSLIL